jgi:GNAT superfamily N-acetyltransferase
MPGLLRRPDNPQPTMQIREANPGDAEALARLSAQLGYPADAGTIAQRLRVIAAHGAGVVLVASGEEAVTGFAQVVPQRFLIAAPFVELAALVVDEKARGSGVGAALLQAAEQWARERGFATMRVRSNVIRERAHRFYLREGYAEKKRQAVFIKLLASGES